MMYNTFNTSIYFNIFNTFNTFKIANILNFYDGFMILLHFFLKAFLIVDLDLWLGATASIKPFVCKKPKVPGKFDEIWVICQIKKIFIMKGV